MSAIAIRPLRLAASLAAVALAAVAAPRAAQAQDIEACYANKSGSMYRVNAPGAPATCSNNGTKVTWPSKLPSGTVTGLEKVTKIGPINPPQKAVSFGVQCPSGKRPIHAEYKVEHMDNAAGDNPQFMDWTLQTVGDAYSSGSSGDWWMVTGVNRTTQYPMRVHVTVTCAHVTP
jgi:hypothetical protein